MGQTHPLPLESLQSPLEVGLRQPLAGAPVKGVEVRSHCMMLFQKDTCGRQLPEGGCAVAGRRGDEHGGLVGTGFACGVVGMLWGQAELVVPRDSEATAMSALMPCGSQLS